MSRGILNWNPYSSVMLWNFGLGEVFTRDGAGDLLEGDETDEVEEI